MRFIPLVLVTKSIPPLSANAISADWIHQRRCCVRCFERPPFTDNKLISLEWPVVIVTRCKPPHLTVGQVCVTAFPDENHQNT